MKKLFFVISVLIFSSIAVSGQNQSDTISMNKVAGGYQYLQDGKVLTLQQLEGLLQTNAESLKLYKSVKSNNVIVYILSFSGGYLIGYPLGMALRGADPVWEMAAIGAGLIAIAIPIANGVTKKLNKAINVYNSGIQPTSFLDDMELKFQVTGNGVGLALRF